MTGWLQCGPTPAARAKEQELLHETIAVLHAKKPLLHSFSAVLCLFCAWCVHLELSPI